MNFRGVEVQNLKEAPVLADMLHLLGTPKCPYGITVSRAHERGGEVQNLKEAQVLAGELHLLPWLSPMYLSRESPLLTTSRESPLLATYWPLKESPPPKRVLY